MKRMLVTGGAGFVGSTLALLFKGYHPEWDVIALDNLRRRGSELAVGRLKKHGVIFVHGDVRVREDFIEVGPVDVIIDCAAEPSVQGGLNGLPDYVVQTNLLGTVNSLELARRTGAVFIFISTSRLYPSGLINSLSYSEGDFRYDLNVSQEVMGVSAEYGISEKFPTNGAKSLYGASKLASELLIEEYAASFGVKSIVNRCGVIAGPWQMGKTDQGIVAFWVMNHIFNEPLSYLGFGGLGKQVRDILHPEDLFCLVDIEIKDIERLSGQTYNVGGGKALSLSLRELTSLCRSCCGVECDITSRSETRPHDIRYYVSDTRKVQQATGWAPTRTLEQIVQETAQWVLDHKCLLEQVRGGS